MLLVSTLTSCEKNKQRWKLYGLHNYTKLSNFQVEVHKSFLMVSWDKSSFFSINSCEVTKNSESEHNYQHLDNDFQAVVEIVFRVFLQ